MVAAEAALQKKAENIVVIDLRSLLAFTDFFIICNGRSEPQLQAIADHIEEKLLDKNVKMHHIEGLDKLKWVLMDYDDFVIHIFLPEVRSYYELEKMWGDSEKYIFDGRIRKSRI